MLIGQRSKTIIRAETIQATQYNVSLGRVRVTTVVVEKQYVLDILSVCGLSYPAGKAHALYYTKFLQKKTELWL